MRNIESIEGWEEELKAVNHTPTNIERVDGYSGDYVPIIPLEIPIQIAEYLLTDSCLRAAVKRLSAWDDLLQERHISADSDEWKNRHPHKARATFNNFLEWYAWKSEVPLFKPVWQIACLQIAFGVLNSDFPSVRSKEVFDFINQNHGKYFA